MKIARICAVLITSTILTSAVHAATATGTLNLSITISATCSVVSATAINFGTHATIPANIDVDSTLTVNCSATTPYVISLNAGGGTAATTTTRRLSNGGTSPITYSLYRNAARTQLWGESARVDTVAGTGAAANQTLTIYGRVFAQGVPAPATYTDAVTITITY